MSSFLCSAWPRRSASHSSLRATAVCPDVLSYRNCPTVSTATPSLSAPALIKDDDATEDNDNDDAIPLLVNEPLTYALPVPKVLGPSSSPSASDLHAISLQLEHLATAVDKLTSSPPSSATPFGPESPTALPSTLSHIDNPSTFFNWQRLLLTPPFHYDA